MLNSKDQKPKKVSNKRTKKGFCKTFDAKLLKRHCIAMPFIKIPFICCLNHNFDPRIKSKFDFVKLSIKPMSGLFFYTEKIK
jgi:hypothetical protein